MTPKPNPPAGLSRKSRQTWRALMDLNDFGAHEIVTFERALVWWDRADAWLAESEALEGKAAAAKAKQSMDAATTALRFWRTLKFTDPNAQARRPGRPSGASWSPKRRAALREVG